MNAGRVPGLTVAFVLDIDQGFLLLPAIVLVIRGENAVTDGGPGCDGSQSLLIKSAIGGT